MKPWVCIVMGSDYPVGEKDPLAFVRGSGVGEDEMQMICGGNAARLLELH